MSDMSKQDASEWLISIKEKYIFGGDEEYDQKRKLAIDMGVEALQNQIILAKTMELFQECIKDEKVLIGFNMAVALCNKYLGKGK